MATTKSDAIFDLVGHSVTCYACDGKTVIIRGTLQVEGPRDERYFVQDDDSANEFRFSAEDTTEIDGRRIIFKPFA